MDAAQYRGHTIQCDFVPYSGSTLKYDTLSWSNTAKLDFLLKYQQCPVAVWYKVAPRVSSKQSNFFFGSNRIKPKLNLFRVFFGLFCETKKHFFRFVSVCFGVSDRYRNNRNKQPKKSPKNVFFQEVLETVIFFLGLKNQNKPKLNLFRLFFGLLFHETKKNFFRFVSMFRTGIETTETNRNYSMGN
jgi:hypothetical protein